jgi:hypothetical protein
MTIHYDGASDVVYNNVKYKPEFIYIFKPSIHKYSGLNESAELIIHHTSNQGGLLVCVPITVGRAITKGSYLLKEIISACPSEINGSSSPNIPDFNANYLIPSSRYFTYEGPFMNQSCNSPIFQYVVFHPRYGSISIDDTTFKLLDNLIHPDVTINASTGPVFVNMKGTTSNGFAGDGQIYIDCQPTGVSEEEVVFKEPGSVATIPSDILMTILLLLIGIALMYGTFLLMKLVLGNVNKVTSSSNL